MALRRLSRRRLRSLVGLDELEAGIGGLGTLADVTNLDEQEQFLVAERGGIDHGHDPYGEFAARF